MQVRVGGDQDILLVSDVVRDGGGSDVGQLRPGHWQAGVVVHWHRGVIVLHLSQHVVQIVNSELWTLHLLPAGRQTLNKKAELQHGR